MRLNLKRLLTSSRKARDISPWDDLVNHTDDLTALMDELVERRGDDLATRNRRARGDLDGHQED